MRNPGFAAVSNLVIPGAGLLRWMRHVVAGYTAYSYAREHPVRR